MRPTLTRSTPAMACAAAVLSLAACGGDADGEKTSATSPESSAASSEPTYDDDYAYAEAKKTMPKLRRHDPNKPIPASADWATANYRRAYNEEVASFKKLGVTTRGTVQVTSTQLAESNRDAVGGWDLSVYVCSVSTTRLYDSEGNDVSADPVDASKSLPKGPRKGAHLYNYTTADQGKTWKLDEVLYLSGKDAEESPCEVS
ncbi:hypothetical protein [Janibacter sp. YB324]|uniref:hypothetical protein n=1 Tax=Janibacter sp. YB324 TaxID=2761047 RepID=UPI001628270A|nr:hypothetical protein [Janibacter sp. YB324]QNF93333.1 hypothetical protein H7A72_11140 [Janibacter sp. YB324]